MAAYEGTILFVVHDRYLIRRFATASGDPSSEPNASFPQLARPEPNSSRRRSPSPICSRAAHYEQLIAPHFVDIERALDALIADGEVRKDSVDVVLRTGGTSLTPAVENLLARRFGPEKIRKQNPFTSVVSGLAMAGNT